MELFLAHQLMVVGRMMLSKLTHPFVDALVPVDLEMSPLDSVNHPVEVHVE